MSSPSFSSISGTKSLLPFPSDSLVERVYNNVQTNFGGKNNMKIVRCTMRSGGTVPVATTYFSRAVISAYLKMPGTTSKVKYWEIDVNGNTRQRSRMVVRGTLTAISLFGDMAREHGKELPEGKAASLGTDATAQEIREHFFTTNDMRSSFPQYVKLGDPDECDDSVLKEAYDSEPDMVKWMVKVGAHKKTPKRPGLPGSS